MPRAFMFMGRFLCPAILTFGLLTLPSAGQVTSRGAGANPASLAQQGMDLAAKGRCTAALPLLTRATPHIADKQLKYNAAIATTRCAMSLHQTEAAVGALLLLNRDFPHDPEVLYVTTHYYSELASNAAQLLAATSPESYQAHELNAEAFESQGKWDEAEAEYKKILDQNPSLPGIHYRLGRVFLTKSNTPSPDETEEGKKELEEELKIDPSNASAEFMLGEIARRDSQWDDAIAHFSRASHTDEGFAEAFLGLGMSYNASGKYAEAIAPLQKYVKMLPADPAGHYQLAVAYARTGRKQEADHEIALQREDTDKLSKAPQAAQELAQPH